MKLYGLGLLIILGLLAGGVAGIISIGCTKNSPPIIHPEGSLVFPTLGQAIQSNDPKTPNECFIAKADPITEDHWSANLIAHGPANETPGNWIIAFSSANPHLEDNNANTNYIEHLLDTLKTLQFGPKAPSAREDVYGLSPPRFALKWKINSKLFELRIGTLVRPNSPNSPNSDEVYAQISNDEGFSQEVVIIRGAALQMLQFLDSFNTLRQQTWAMFSTDDIDEIELFHKKQSILYAQRDGSNWTDRKHHPLKVNIDAFLEGLAHARVASFVDDQALNQKLYKSVQSNPEHQVLLTDRNAHTTRLLLKADLGITSMRPGAVFRLYPETKALFNFGH